MMRYGWDGGWAPVVMIVGSILWAAVVVGVIVLIVVGIRWLLRHSEPGGTLPGRSPGAIGDDPMEILRQRYARGEIDDEEFERRKRVLGG